MEKSRARKVKKSPKKGTKKRKNRQLHLNNPSNEPVSLERYSALNKMPPFMVWEQIKKGKILAREINGEIYILPQTQASSASSLDVREGAIAGQLTTEDKEVILSLIHI